MQKNLGGNGNSAENKNMDKINRTEAPKQNCRRNPKRRYFFLFFVKTISGDYMLITLIRALILYLLIFFCMRIMGKRQIGELQPTELVITILLSEIAAIPMQDNAIPMGNSIIAVMFLVALEVLNSAACLKSAKLRSLIEGNSLVIIRDGVLDQKQLKKLRFSVDDLLDQLRQKDIFNIEDVRFAMVETNGQLSVMLKPESQPVTAGMVDIKPESKSLMCMVVDNGEIRSRPFSECDMTHEKLSDILSENGVELSEIFFMLADKEGNYTIVKKDEYK